LRQKQAEILATMFLKNLNQELSQYADLLVQLLSVDIYEVRLSTIEIISKLLKNPCQDRYVKRMKHSFSVWWSHLTFSYSIDRDGLRRKLLRMIYEEETHLDCLKNAVLLLTQLNSTNPYLDDGSMAFSITDFWGRLVHQMQCSKNQSTQEAILPLMGAQLAQVHHHWLFVTGHDESCFTLIPTILLDNRSFKHNSILLRSCSLWRPGQIRLCNIAIRMW